jgi:hypothetical protein
LPPTLFLPRTAAFLFTGAGAASNLLVYRAEHGGSRRRRVTADVKRSRDAQGETRRGLAADDRAGVTIQGSREDALSRPRAHDTGVYQRRPEQTLDDQQVEMLNQRMAGQRF